MKKLTTLFICMCFLSAQAASWRLNNNPAINANFKTFADAQNAASPGDTIYIEGNGIEAPYGDLVISKKLVLIGPGFFLTENDSTSANPLVARVQSVFIQSTAAGTEIYGLYFFTNDGNTNRLKIRASDVIISRNYFYASGYNDILIDDNIHNVVISQNFVHQITAAAAGTNILITNNYIHYRILLNLNSSALISNNVVGSAIENVYNSQIKNNIILSPQVTDYLSAGLSGNFVAYNLSLLALPAGTYGPGNVGNVDMSTVFVGYPEKGQNSSDARFLLKKGGPAEGSGEGGIDCGMFGGSLPYVLSGLPPVPRIYEAIVPTAGSSSSGLPVIIKMKSQN